MLLLSSQYVSSSPIISSPAGFQAQLDEVQKDIQVSSFLLQNSPVYIIQG
jgi:hypothetical protein